MKEITMYEAEDCTRFTNKTDCVQHEANCAMALRATELFSQGSTLLDAIRSSGFEFYTVGFRGVAPVEVSPLTGFDKDCRFIIPHWQCNDNPVYRIEAIRHDGRLWVSGNRSWMGFYSEWCTLRELEQYSWTRIKDYQHE